MSEQPERQSEQPSSNTNLTERLLEGVYSPECSQQVNQPENPQVPKNLTGQQLKEKLSESYRSGEYYITAQVASDAIKNDPKNATAYLYRAYARQGLGYHNEAKDDYSKAIQIEPSNISAYYSRATVNAELGQTEEAIKDLDKGISLLPSDMKKDPETAATLFSYRGAQKSELKDYKSAISDFSTVINVQPDNWTAYVDRSWQNLLAHNYQNTVDDSTKVINAYDNKLQEDKRITAESPSNRGAALVAMGKFDDALQDYQRCLDLGGTADATEIYKNRAGLYDKLGKKDLAEKDREEIKKIESSDKGKKVEQDKLVDSITSAIVKGKISEEQKRNLTDNTGYVFGSDRRAADLERHVNDKLTEQGSNLRVDFNKITNVPDSVHADLDKDRLLRIYDKVSGKTIDELRFPVTRTRSR